MESENRVPGGAKCSGYFSTVPKAAVFNLDTNTLIAEGEADGDWMALQLEYEKLREEGNYRLVVTPYAEPGIGFFGLRKNS